MTSIFSKTLMQNRPFLTNVLRKYSSSSQSFIQMESEYGCHNYHPLPVVISSGSGIYLTDVEGKKYMDFLAAYSAVNQGHCHPRIKEALKKQIDSLTLTSRAFYTDQLGLTEKYLCNLFQYDKALLMNSGVEAGESGIKIARRWAYDIKKVPNNQAKVIFAKGNFWGRTIAACASSDDPERYSRFGPFGGLNFTLIEYNDIEALKQELEKDPNVAAVMLEPIQGERGVFIPSSGYMRNVKELCQKHNVLLIADEIQTGLGRTGKLLACEWDSMKPDILLLGKALSGGFYPVSAVLCNNSIMNTIKPGEHGSTYGGNPLASAVTRAALDVLLEEKMIENSLKMGEALLKGLREIQKQKSFVKETRGRGLMCALEMREDFKTSAWDICLELKNLGLLAKPTHNNIIRMTPPLIITKAEVDKSLEIIKKALDKF